ncbi:MAG TPA: TetR/AcrR family transcriptional regulator [Bacteroidetes bacterium]|nr:TetR/AcrR family transcriptional regulator [Bacteroidota bacterium]
MAEISTKDRLVKETARLMQIKGYYGTGLKEILLNSGVPKGSLYHHFPKGKDSLVVASLQFSSDRMLENYSAAMRGTKSPLAGLSAILDTLADHLEKSDFQLGCPLATVALETNSSDSVIRESLAKMYQHWEDSLTSYLALKGVSNPQEKARLFLTVLEGGLLLSKAHGDSSFLRKLKNDLKILLPG